MLVLKLTLVPLFLLTISLIGRRFGPTAAGWLAGLPLVTGPILFLLALEYGNAFAARAAVGALAGVLASLAFTTTYARVAQRRTWAGTLPWALATWVLCTSLLALVDFEWWSAALLALTSVALAPRLYPPVTAPLQASPLPPRELALRMTAGAALTLAVTAGAPHLGVRLSGLLTVFPVLSVVLSVATHRTNGPAFTAALLRGLAHGMYAFTAFCLTIALTLPHLPLGAGFGLAIAVCLLVQVGSRYTLRRPTGGG